MLLYNVTDRRRKAAENSKKWHINEEAIRFTVENRRQREANGLLGCIGFRHKQGFLEIREQRPHSEAMPNRMKIQSPMRTC